MRIFFTKKWVIISIIILALVGGGVYWKTTSTKAPAYDLVEVKKGTVSQEVTVTGRVEPAEDAMLSFETGGIVRSIAVEVGAAVKRSDIIMSLDTRSLDAEIRKALAGVTSAQSSYRQYEAALETQRAQLEELKQGTRIEDIAVAEAQVKTAEQVLADAKINLSAVTSDADISLNNLYGGVSDVLSDAYFDADDAVRKQVNDFFIFTNDYTNPSLSFITSDNLAKNNSEIGRQQMNTVLSKYKNLIISSITTQQGYDQALTEAESYIIEVNNFLLNVAATVSASTSLTETTLNTYKGYVNTARSNVNTSLSNIRTKQQSIATQKATAVQSLATANATVSKAESDLEVAKRQLDAKKASATPEQLRAKEAAVSQAEANVAVSQASIAQANAAVENLRAQLDKLILRSPIDGIVSKQDMKLGEIVSPNITVAMIISGSQFEVKADVPEADIAKIKLGNSAKVTLDAYGSEIDFPATIIKIDPAERIIEGVATYRVTLQFNNQDERIKSGMTANIDIQGEYRENILFVPTRAVTIKNGERYVQVLKNNLPEEVKVTVGLKGSDGNIEILSGLNEGDKIILSSLED